MLTTLILTALLADQTPIACAVMNDNPASGKLAMEYAGSKYSFCCGGCPSAFAKNPTKFAHNDKVTVAEFLFDPVSGHYVDRDKSGLKTDYKGIRYSFNNKEDSDMFAKNPEKYSKVPSKEVLQCPLSNEKFTSYGQAYGYIDVKDVRYFICCNNCFPKVKANPDAAVKNEKGVPTVPVALKWVDAKPEIH